MEERRLTKHEVKGIRKVLGLTQQEFADLLGVSCQTIQKNEQVNRSSYKQITKPLDRKIRSKLIEMGIEIDDILMIVYEKKFN